MTSRRIALSAEVTPYLVAACFVYAALLLTTALSHPEPLALAALLALPALVVVRHNAVAIAAVMIAGGILLRLSYWEFGEADQLAVTGGAIRAVLEGGNPYGRGYVETIPAGAPFPYGPLALVVHAPGIWAEFAASVIVLMLIARERAWMTLAFCAAAVLPVSLTTSGINDWVPGTILTAGLITCRSRPRLGAALVATAAAVKPYAAAWFFPLIGYAGSSVIAPLVVATALLWSPLLVWGPATFIRSLEMARAVHVIPSALNIPELRLLAIPMAALSLGVRSWVGMVSAGAVIFVLVLFLDGWATDGYWLAVLPIIGIAVERSVDEFRHRVRAGHRVAGAPTIMVGDR